jgi:Tfp pilus assembly protein PilO
MTPSKNPKKSAPSKIWPIHATGLVLCLLITGVTYHLCLRIPVNRYLGMELQRYELHQASQDSTNLARSMDQLNLQLAKIQREIDAAPVKMRPTSHVNQMLARLGELATERGLIIKSVQPGSLQPGKQYETIPIAFTAAGTYRTCTQFLSDLHEQCPDTVVLSFSLTGNPTDTASTANIHTDMLWYALPEQADAD